LPPPPKTVKQKTSTLFFFFNQNKKPFPKTPGTFLQPHKVAPRLKKHQEKLVGQKKNFPKPNPNTPLLTQVGKNVRNNTKKPKTGGGGLFILLVPRQTKKTKKKKTQRAPTGDR